MPAQPIDPRAFRQVLRQFCTGITIITTMHDGEPQWLRLPVVRGTILDPHWCCSAPPRCPVLKAIESSGRFCVNVLTEKQRDTCAVWIQGAR